MTHPTISQAKRIEFFHPHVYVLDARLDGNMPPERFSGDRMERKEGYISAVSRNVPNPAYVNNLSPASTFPVTEQAYKLSLHAWWNLGFAAHRVAGGHRLAPCININVQMCAAAVEVRL